MKITFMHEGGIQEFTPPDFATSVVIKTRPNGVSIDYESSTVDAVADYFARTPTATVMKNVEALKPPVKQPVLHRGKKGVGWKLTPADKDRIVKEWVEKKTSYDTLAARYKVHRTTVSDIIHRAMKKPMASRPVKNAGKKKTWDRRPLPEDIRMKVLEAATTGGLKTHRAIADATGVSMNSVSRILAGKHHPGRKHSLTPFQEDEIVRLIDEGAIARQAIADKFKVHVTTVNRVLAKKRKENYNKELAETTT